MITKVPQANRRKNRVPRYQSEDSEYESYLLVQDLKNEIKIKTEKKISVDEAIERNVREIIHANEEQRFEIKELLLQFSDIFAVDYKGLSQTNIVKCSIDTGDTKPIHFKPFTLAHADREFVRNRDK